ncbi:hypothetical protein ACFLU6_14080, partial [Acidobacteriota bacterium]
RARRSDVAGVPLAARGRLCATTARKGGHDGHLRRSLAAQGMRGGPSEPAGRGRLQTTSSCCGQKPWW